MKQKEGEIRNLKKTDNMEYAAGSMNVSEYISYVWLINNKGYDSKDILFNHTSTPDFLCNDGKKYEVKRLYGRSILIYDKQVSKLDGCIIVVVDTKKRQVIKEFEWDNREDIIIPAIKITNTGLHIYISQDLERRIVLLGLDRKGVNDFINIAALEKLNREKKMEITMGGTVDPTYTAGGTGL